MANTYQYNYGVINYADTGKGQPVVLLHGCGEDSSIWSNQIEHLQSLCRLIVPDLPGSGASSLLKVTNATLSDYADCIKGLLDDLSIKECILLGHSMGGYITLAFAEKFPEMLTGFGLVNSTAYADTEEKIATRRKGIKFIEDNGAYAFLKTSIPNLFADSFKKQHPEVIETLIEKGRGFTSEALIQYYQAMISRPDRTNVLKDSKVPVLFIIGTEDNAAPMKNVLEQAHLPKMSFIKILEATGHMSMLERPGQLNNYLSDFINEVEGFGKTENNN